MNRRDFLKVGGLTTLLLSLPIYKLTEYYLAPLEIEFKGRFFRGTRDGEIHVSTDQKKTWKKQAGFGSQYSVNNLFTDRSGRLNAEMKFADMNFNLVLADDGSVWRVM
jgi:hypothetical protein